MLATQCVGVRVSLVLIQFAAPLDLPMNDTTNGNKQVQCKDFAQYFHFVFLKWV